MNSRFRPQATDLSKEELAEEFAARARLSATEAAEIILKGVRRKRRRILVGRDARFLDLLIRLFPGSYEKLLQLERDVQAWRRRSQAQS